MAPAASVAGTYLCRSRDREMGGQGIGGSARMWARLPPREAAERSTTLGVNAPTADQQLRPTTPHLRPTEWSCDFDYLGSGHHRRFCRA